MEYAEPSVQGHRENRTPTVPVVTTRDEDIVRWITRHGLVTADQVEARFFGSPWAAYRRLRALERLKLIRRDLTHYRHPAVIRVTMQGAQLAAVGVGPARLVPHAVPHSLAVVDLTERVLRDHPGNTLITEREFRAAELRALREGTLTRCPRIPDGILVLSRADGAERVALELDLTPKRTREIKSVVDAYARMYDAYPDDEHVSAVWWWVLPATVERVRILVRTLGADDFITVKGWER